MTALPQFDLPETLPSALRLVPDAISLSGHSGAELRLLVDGTMPLVRKTAGSVLQNARLMAQSRKQRSLFSCGVPFPIVPFDGIDSEGRAYFDMEYVPGRTAAEVILDGDRLDEGLVTDAVARFLEFARFTNAMEIPPDLFLSKIVVIEGARTPACRLHAREISRIARRLKAQDWSGIPASLCHGDMTLENMIVSAEGGVVFIDCDDCFTSSWWLDAAKLFQDVAGHWCIRSLYLDGPRDKRLLKATEQLGRLEIALRHLFDTLEPRLAPRLLPLTALHLFRTIPYARDEETVGFVLRSIEKVLAS